MPGNYSLTFGAAGFTTFVRQGIDLQAQVITVDAQLKPSEPPAPKWW